ncbi:PH domain-containing protein [Sporosarcina sp. ACRSL]|uniref:PH domain-containing protein n=1 Tax=Sporosarcina sp. ACRSL TaxID=2918215 RepID=UPI001EF64CC4|nr:PH domain-containing protein [Sporosarcina sp. ACRSL]MCG7344910.1 PH domain-containing protein [Sporosarcina sp. ACRSL]
MYFPSKKDIWFFLAIWGFIFFIIFIYIFGGEPIGWQIVTYKSVLGYIGSAMMIALLLWVWFGTGYRIEGDIMKIRYGPFRSKIAISDITKIRKTTSPFTAPSLSVDRLEILYGKYDVVNVSPKKVDEFIRELVSRNPHIQVDVHVTDRK